MILPAQYIKHLCLTQGMVVPFNERTVVDGMSFGLSAASYDMRIAQTCILDPGEFMLASTVEQFRMPNHVLGIVHDKSTWARRGIATQNTLIDPGWHGYLTLELSNHSDKQIAIYSGQPIAQIVFHLLKEPTEQPYNGKYQNQQSGPVSAINEN